jgi:hypothetical protein
LKKNLFFEKTINFVEKKVNFFSKFLRVFLVNVQNYRYLDSKKSVYTKNNQKIFLRIFGDIKSKKNDFLFFRLLSFILELNKRKKSKKINLLFLPNIFQETLKNV